MKMRQRRRRNDPRWHLFLNRLHAVRFRALVDCLDRTFIGALTESMRGLVELERIFLETCVDVCEGMKRDLEADIERTKESHDLANPA